MFQFSCQLSLEQTQATECTTVPNIACSRRAIHRDSPFPNSIAYINCIKVLHNISLLSTYVAVVVVVVVEVVVEVVEVVRYFS